MKQSHLFTPPRPKRTYPFLAALDVFCHFFLCGLGFVLGIIALRLILSTFAPSVLPSIVQFAMRLFRM